ncbi:MAG: hypothetical protein ACRELV_16420, partial [Longimicrobiales bacterium]
AAAARLIPEIAARMRGARDRRPRPFVDETVYADSTAMVAAGHLAAARYLGDTDAADAAFRALERVWAEGFRPDAGLLHRPGDPSAGEYLSDQACVLGAILDAFELAQRTVWLERARSLADLLIARFTDDGNGGFLDRPHDAHGPGALELPHRPIADAPEPSGNGAAALALLRLAGLSGVTRYGDVARRTLAAFAGTARAIATAAATYLRAVDWATAPTTSVVIVGSGEPARDLLLATALRTYRPRTVVRRFVAGDVDEAALPEAVRAMLGVDAPRAYVCVGAVCEAPVASPDELDAILRRRP